MKTKQTVFGRPHRAEDAVCCWQVSCGQSAIALKHCDASSRLAVETFVRWCQRASSHCVYLDNLCATAAPCFSALQSWSGHLAVIVWQSIPPKCCLRKLASKHQHIICRCCQASPWCKLETHLLLKAYLPLSNVLSPYFSHSSSSVLRQRCRRGGRPKGSRPSTPWRIVSRCSRQHCCQRWCCLGMHSQRRGYCGRPQ